MKPININTIHRGFLRLQEVTMENPEGLHKVIERVVHSPAVVAICHDPINDNVMLVEQYRYGPMMRMQEFPAGLIDEGELPSEAIQREILEETGVTIKSASSIHEYMAMPGSLQAHMDMFYATFDSREVVDGAEFTTSPFEITKIVMKTAKELIREVDNGEHLSVPVILGAQYLKLLHRGLVR